MTNKFKVAAQKKLRYQTTRGTLAVEDLYDLPLTSEKGVSLDSVARDVHNELKATQQESFVESASKGSQLLELKLDIVKDIISDRIVERDARKAALANKTKLDRLLALKAQKEDEALGEMSQEQLDAEIAKLSA